jgi:hypothetical protein
MRKSDEKINQKTPTETPKKYTGESGFKSKKKLLKCGGILEAYIIQTVRSFHDKCFCKICVDDSFVLTP